MLDAIFSLRANFGVSKLYKNGFESKIKNPVLSRVFNLGTDIDIECVYGYIRRGVGMRKSGLMLSLSNGKDYINLEADVNRGEIFGI